MKKKKAIFEFFGINKPLFLMGGLEGDEIRRFIDREEELQNVRRNSTAIATERNKLNPIEYALLFLWLAPA